MVFKPLTLDGQAAARRLLAQKTNRVHQCLYEVFQSFPFERSDKPGAYSSARVQWERTPPARRRVGDRGVPAGAIVLFDLAVASTRDKRPGHIGISLGGDRLVSTDWPIRGQVGVATIGEIERRWDATYLGWTDVIGGHNVTVGTDPDVIVGAPAGGVLVRRSQFVNARNGLWFRAAPKLTGKRLRLLKKGTIVVTTGRISGKWEEADVDGVKGWLHSGYIYWRNRTVTAKAGLNLRATPSTKGRVVATLTDRTKVTVLAARSKWRQVRVGTRTGWVHGGYLK